MSIDPSKVSVVMTVRDGERHIAAALTSILGQSVSPGEIIVVDDGSTDGTAEVLARFGDVVRVVPQEPTGTAAGLNRGLATSTGAIVGFLDSDDLWPPDALERRLDRLAGADTPDAVFGRTVQFVSDEVPADQARRLRIDSASISSPLLGALLVRREIFETVGPFDESLPSAEGVDWVTRARDAHFHLVAIDDLVLRRRLHTANTGRTLPRETTLAALRSVVLAHHRRRSAH